MKKFKVLIYLFAIIFFIIIILEDNKITKDITPNLKEHQDISNNQHNSKDIKEENNQLTKEQQANPEKSNSSFIERTISSSIKQFIENDNNKEFLENMINNNPAIPKGTNLLYKLPENVVIKDLEIGQGSIAECGQTVKIENISNNQSTMQQYILGENVAAPEIEQSLLGMRVGSKRKIQIRNKDNNYNVQINLLSASPKISYTPIGLQVFDKKIGTGQEAICGNKVQIVYKVFNLEGKILFTSKPILANMGQGNVPFGIIKALLYQKEGGVRTVLMPVAYLKPLYAAHNNLVKSFFPEELKLPNKEITIFEIELKSISK